MPVKPGTGQGLARDTAALRSCTGLQHVEEREPNGLLQDRIPIDGDVRAIPEVVKVGSLLLEQHVEAAVAGPEQSRGHLVTQPACCSLARPGVGQQLDHAQPFSRSQHADGAGASPVGPRVSDGLNPPRSLDQVVHADGRPLR